MKYKQEFILIMLGIYAIVLAFDFNLTMTDPSMESNLIAVGWIVLTGIPLNLFLQYIVIGVPLFYRKTWDKIDTKLPMFLFFYIYMLVMIVGHITGIVSWVC